MSQLTQQDGLIIMANFNQAIEIGKVLERLPKYYDKNHVVVVDDGSKDGSDQIAENMGYQVLHHNQNMGIGAAIRTGIRYAQKKGYKFVTIMSSNGKIRPEDLEAVTAPILRGEAEYVTGSRFLELGSSPGLTVFRRLAIPVISILSSFILGRRFSDITCGYRSYVLSIFDDPKMRIDQEWLNRYEMEYYIHYWACRQKIRIVEVPVHIMYTHLEKGRKSKIKPFVGWWSMMRPFVLLVLRIKN